MGGRGEALACACSSELGILLYQPLFVPARSSTHPGRLPDGVGSRTLLREKGSPLWMDSKLHCCSLDRLIVFGYVKICFCLYLNVFQISFRKFQEISLPHAPMGQLSTWTTNPLFKSILARNLEWETPRVGEVGGGGRRRNSCGQEMKHPSLCNDSNDSLLPSPNDALLGCSVLLLLLS